MKRLLFFLLFLSACGGAIITEEWPEGYPQKIIGTEEKEYLVPEVKPIEKSVFSVIEGQPIEFIQGNESHKIELLEVVQERARLRIDDVSFMMGLNKTAIRSGVKITIDEIAKDIVPIPRRSVVDLTADGARERLYVGQAITFGNVSVKVDFIGLKEGEPKTRIVVGRHSAILSEKEEHRFDEFWVYVHGVYFTDATEHELADAVTISVQ